MKLLGKENKNDEKDISDLNLAKHLLNNARTRKKTLRRQLHWELKILEK